MKKEFCCSCGARLLEEDYEKQGNYCRMCCAKTSAIANYCRLKTGKLKNYSVEWLKKNYGMTLEELEERCKMPASFSKALGKVVHK